MDHLKDKIKNPSIYDVARLSDVSPSTVSRVLNKRHYGSDQIRARVTAAAMELNYSPQVTTARNRLPLLIDESPEGVDIGSYEAQMISRVCGQCASHGLLVEVIPVRSMSLLAMNRATAAISVTFRSDTTSLVAELGIPLVSINNPIEGAWNVQSDHRGGVRMAIDHLNSFNHQRIGLICSNLQTWGNLERIEGFREAMRDMGEDDQGLLLLEDHTNNSILEPICRLLKRGATALIFSGESIGLRAQHAFDLLGKRIGSDISVIMFEDPLISQYTSPPQTTIAQPFEKLARIAVDRAVHISQSGRSEATDTPSPIVLPNRLITRESVCRI